MVHSCRCKLPVNHGCDHYAINIVSFSGPPNRFSSSGPHQVSGGGRGRPPGGNGHPPPHRGHSPSAPSSSMENSSMVGGVRGARGDHYAPSGGRYRRENNEELKKIPRLNRSRHRPTEQPPPPPPPPSSSSSSTSSQSSHTPQQTQEKTQPLPVSGWMSVCVCVGGGGCTHSHEV